MGQHANRTVIVTLLLSPRIVQCLRVGNGKERSHAC